jgi:hypothetical protein
LDALSVRRLPTDPDGSVSLRERSMGVAVRLRRPAPTLERTHHITAELAAPLFVTIRVACDAAGGACAEGPPRVQRPSNQSREMNRSARPLHSRRPPRGSTDSRSSARPFHPTPGVDPPAAGTNADGPADLKRSQGRGWRDP